jgi:hypothetical protein
MRIEFCSISMMVSIVDQLRLHNIMFECKVDDLGCGFIWLEEIERHEVLAKIVA